MSIPRRSDGSTPRVVREAALDWVKFDARIARDGSIDPVDKALYAALASFADAEARDTDPNPDGEDIPTRAVLAECIGRSLDTVDRATRRLEDLGVLRVERRKDPHRPRAHLPSVYVLLDHEWWDERAAARAQARAEARQKATAGRRGSRMDAARGSRTGAARGSRTDAARGSRTGAAVPYSSKKVSLSEVTRDAHAPENAPVLEARDAPTTAGAERETTPPKDERRERAAAIAAEWTAGTGQPRVPSSERKIREAAAELLAEGHDPARLAAVARWMAQKGWRDLGYALTAPNAPTGRSAPPASRPQWCGTCDERTRLAEDAEGRPYRCPTCHPSKEHRPAS